MDERIRWQNETGDTLAHKLDKAAAELYSSNSEMKQVLNRVLSFCHGTVLHSAEKDLTRLIRRSAELADRLDSLSRAVEQANETFATVEQQLENRARMLQNGEQSEQAARSSSPMSMFMETLTIGYDCPDWLAANKPLNPQAHLRIELSSEITFVPEPMPMELSRYKL